MALKFLLCVHYPFDPLHSLSPNSTVPSRFQKHMQQNSELNLSDYDIFRRDRPDRTGGGVFICVKKIPPKLWSLARQTFGICLCQNCNP